MAVVDDCDIDDAVDGLSFELNDDVVGFSVETVPHEFDDRPDGVILVRRSLDEVIAGFKL